MDADIANRFGELELYVRRYGGFDFNGATYWDGFYTIAGPVTIALAEDPNPNNREHDRACLGVPDERGFKGASKPTQQAQD